MALQYFEHLVTVYRTTLHNIPEDLNLQCGVGHWCGASVFCWKSLLLEMRHASFCNEGILCLGELKRNVLYWCLDVGNGSCCKWSGPWTVWQPALTHWGRVTQICVFNTRLFSLHNTLNYAIHRACLRMVLLTDVCRNLTSLWINL